MIEFNVNRKHLWKVFPHPNELLIYFTPIQKISAVSAISGTIFLPSFITILWIFFNEFLYRNFVDVGWSGRTSSKIFVWPRLNSALQYFPVKKEESKVQSSHELFWVRFILINCFLFQKEVFHHCSVFNYFYIWNISKVA